MADETITRQVSERSARALATGQQMCCPTRYPFEDLRRFVPEEVLGASYGCGTPAGLATVRPGETVLASAPAAALTASRLRGWWGHPAG